MIIIRRPVTKEGDRLLSASVTAGDSLIVDSFFSFGFAGRDETILLSNFPPSGLGGIESTLLVLLRIIKKLFLEIKSKMSGAYSVIPENGEEILHFIYSLFSK